jgi:hypothetical protein
MKNFRVVKNVLLALAFLPVANVFAANKGSLHVSSPEDVEGQTLSTGDYTVRWDGDGPDVELKIMQGKRIVATATAHMQPLPGAAANNAVEVDTSGGRRSLSLIFFLGNPVAFEIQRPAPGVQLSSK